jgi:nucleotide sugar dehydrogenase
MRPDLTFPHQADETSDIRIAYCVERVLPGRIVHELVANDRVIGGMTAKCAEAAIGLYKLFARGECIVTDTRAAEMCKLAENSFRDLNIAFANEFSMICDEQKINAWELIRLANRHPRVNILQPGCGVGGHCIAIDLWFLVDSSRQQARLIRTGREVNDAKSNWVIHKVEQAITELSKKDDCTEDLRIACLGLTFKPDVNDLRESPALRIIQTLAKRYKGKVAAVEPNLRALPNVLSDTKVTLIGLDAAILQSHILVVLVDHSQFKCIKPKLSPCQSLIDTRGIWSNKK